MPGEFFGTYPIPYLFDNHLFDGLWSTLSSQQFCVFHLFCGSIDSHSSFIRLCFRLFRSFRGLSLRLLVLSFFSFFLFSLIHPFPRLFRIRVLRNAFDGGGSNFGFRIYPSSSVVKSFANSFWHLSAQFATLPFKSSYMQNGFQLERATPNHFETLTRIAFAAKAHWGYPAQWLERWRPELAIAPEYIRDNWVIQCVKFDPPGPNEVVGFYGFSNEATSLQLQHLWIEPGWIGHGFGRRLFEHAMETARLRGHKGFDIEADPNAEGFYLKMGARRVGEIRRDMFGTERIVPLLYLTL